MKLGRYNVRGRQGLGQSLPLTLYLPSFINNRDLIKAFPSHYTYPASLTTETWSKPSPHIKALIKSLLLMKLGRYNVRGRL
jgi:hypothetical protein